MACVTNKYTGEGIPTEVLKDVKEGFRLLTGGRLEEAQLAEQAYKFLSVINRERIEKDPTFKAIRDYYIKRYKSQEEAMAQTWGLYILLNSKLRSGLVEGRIRAVLDDIMANRGDAPVSVSVIRDMLIDMRYAKQDVAELTGFSSLEQQTLIDSVAYFLFQHKGEMFKGSVGDIEFLRKAFGEWSRQLIEAYEAYQQMEQRPDNFIDYLNSLEGIKDNKLVQTFASHNISFLAAALKRLRDNNEVELFFDRMLAPKLEGLGIKMENIGELLDLKKEEQELEDIQFGMLDKSMEYNKANFEQNIDERLTTVAKLALASIPKMVYEKDGEGNIIFDENGLPKMRVAENELGMPSLVNTDVVVNDMRLLINRFNFKSLQELKNFLLDKANVNLISPHLVEVGKRLEGLDTKTLNSLFNSVFTKPSKLKILTYRVTRSWTDGKLRKRVIISHNDSVREHELIRIKDDFVDTIEVRGDSPIVVVKDNSYVVRPLSEEELGLVQRIREKLTDLPEEESALRERFSSDMSFFADLSAFLEWFGVKIDPIALQTMMLDDGYRKYITGSESLVDLMKGDFKDFGFSNLEETLNRLEHVGEEGIEIKNISPREVFSVQALNFYSRLVLEFDPEMTGAIMGQNVEGSTFYTQMKPNSLLFKLDEVKQLSFEEAVAKLDGIYETQTGGHFWTMLMRDGTKGVTVEDIEIFHVDGVKDLYRNIGYERAKAPEDVKLFDKLSRFFLNRVGENGQVEEAYYYPEVWADKKTTPLLKAPSIGIKEQVNILIDSKTKTVKGIDIGVNSKVGGYLFETLVLAEARRINKMVEEINALGEEVFKYYPADVVNHAFYFFNIPELNSPEMSQKFRMPDGSINIEALIENKAAIMNLIDRKIFEEASMLYEKIKEYDAPSSPFFRTGVGKEKKFSFVSDDYYLMGFGRSTLSIEEKNFFALVDFVINDKLTSTSFKYGVIGEEYLTPKKVKGLEAFRPKDLINHHIKAAEKLGANVPITSSVGLLFYGTEEAKNRLRELTGMEHIPDLYDVVLGDLRATMTEARKRNSGHIAPGYKGNWEYYGKDGKLKPKTFKVGDREYTAKWDDVLVVIAKEQEFDQYREMYKDAFGVDKYPADGANGQSYNTLKEHFIEAIAWGKFETDGQADVVLQYLYEIEAKNADIIEEARQRLGIEDLSDVGQRKALFEAVRDKLVLPKVAEINRRLEEAGEPELELEVFKDVYNYVFNKPYSALAYGGKMEGEIGVSRLYIKTSSAPLIPDIVEGTNMEVHLRYMTFLEAVTGKPVKLSMSTAVKVGIVNPKELWDTAEDGYIQNYKENINGQDVDVTRLPEATPLVLTREGHFLQQEERLDERFDVAFLSQVNRLVEAELHSTELAENSNFELGGQKVSAQIMLLVKDVVARLITEGGLLRVYKELLNLSKGEYNYLRHQILTGNAKNPLELVSDMHVNVERLRSLLLEEIDKRGYPSYMKDFLKTDEKGDMLMPFYLNPIAHRLSAVLVSFFNRYVVRKRLDGKLYVQVSPEILGGRVGLSKEIIWTTDKPINKLRFLEYDTKEGKVIDAQIILSQEMLDEAGHRIDMKEFIIEKDGKKFLDTSKIDPKILEQVGFRVPNQGYSSMLLLEVVGFLPSYMRNMAIVPAEITRQMGSDFDIDHLYVYAKSYVFKRDLDGSIFKFKGLSEQEFERLGQSYQVNKLKEISEAIGNINRAIGNDVYYERLFKGMKNMHRNTFNELRSAMDEIGFVEFLFGDQEALAREYGELFPAINDIEVLDRFRKGVIKYVMGNDFKTLMKAARNKELIDSIIKELQEKAEDNPDMKTRIDETIEMLKTLSGKTKGSLKVVSLNYDEIIKTAKEDASLLKGMLSGSNEKILKTAYVDVIRGILKNPDIARKSIQPLDMAEIPELVDKIIAQKAKNSKGFLSGPNAELEAFYINQAGKQSVAFEAIATAMLAKLEPFQRTPKRTSGVTLPGLKVKVDGRQLFLDTIGVGKYESSVEPGRRISSYEVLSAMLSEAVDNAKFMRLGHINFNADTSKYYNFFAIFASEGREVLPLPTVIAMMTQDAVMSFLKKRSYIDSPESIVAEWLKTFIRNEGEINAHLERFRQLLSDAKDGEIELNTDSLLGTIKDRTNLNEYIENNLKTLAILEALKPIVDVFQDLALSLTGYDSTGIPSNPSALVTKAYRLERVRRRLEEMQSVNKDINLEPIINWLDYLYEIEENPFRNEQTDLLSNTVGAITHVFNADEKGRPIFLEIFAKDLLPLAEGMGIKITNKSVEDLFAGLKTFILTTEDNPLFRGEDVSYKRYQLTSGETSLAYRLWQLKVSEKYHDNPFLKAVDFRLPKGVRFTTRGVEESGRGKYDSSTIFVQSKFNLSDIDITMAQKGFMQLYNDPDPRVRNIAIDAVKYVFALGDFSAMSIAKFIDMTVLEDLGVASFFRNLDMKSFLERNKEAFIIQFAQHNPGYLNRLKVKMWDKTEMPYKMPGQHEQRYVLKQDVGGKNVYLYDSYNQYLYKIETFGQGWRKDIHNYDASKMFAISHTADNSLVLRGERFGVKDVPPDLFLSKELQPLIRTMDGVGLMRYVEGLRKNKTYARYWFIMDMVLKDREIWSDLNNMKIDFSIGTDGVVVEDRANNILYIDTKLRRKKFDPEQGFVWEEGAVEDFDFEAMVADKVLSYLLAKHLEKTIARDNVLRKELENMIEELKTTAEISDIEQFKYYLDKEHPERLVMGMLFDKEFAALAGDVSYRNLTLDASIDILVRNVMTLLGSSVEGEKVNRGLLYNMIGELMFSDKLYDFPLYNGYEKGFYEGSLSTLKAFLDAKGARNIGVYIKEDYAATYLYVDRAAFERMIADSSFNEIYKKFYEPEALTNSNGYVKYVPRIRTKKKRYEKNLPVIYVYDDVKSLERNLGIEKGELPVDVERALLTRTGDNLYIAKNLSSIYSIRENVMVKDKNALSNLATILKSTDINVFDREVRDDYVSLDIAVGYRRYSVVVKEADRSVHIEDPVTGMEVGRFHYDSLNDIREGLIVTTSFYDPLARIKELKGAVAVSKEVMKSIAEAIGRREYLLIEDGTSDYLILKNGLVFKKGRELVDLLQKDGSDPSIIEGYMHYQTLPDMLSKNRRFWDAFLGYHENKKEFGYGQIVYKTMFGKISQSIKLNRVQVDSELFRLESRLETARKYKGEYDISGQGMYYTVIEDNGTKKRFLALINLVHSLNDDFAVQSRNTFKKALSNNTFRQMMEEAFIANGFIKTGEDILKAIDSKKDIHVYLNQLERALSSYMMYNLGEEMLIRTMREFGIKEEYKENLLQLMKEWVAPSVPAKAVGIVIDEMIRARFTGEAPKIKIKGVNVDEKVITKMVDQLEEKMQELGVVKVIANRFISYSDKIPVKGFDGIAGEFDLVCLTDKGKVVVIDVKTISASTGGGKKVDYAEGRMSDWQKQLSLYKAVIKERVGVEPDIYVAAFALDYDVAYRESGLSGRVNDGKMVKIDRESNYVDQPELTEIEPMPLTEVLAKSEYNDAAENVRRINFLTEMDKAVVMGRTDPIYIASEKAGFVTEDGVVIRTNDAILSSVYHNLKNIMEAQEKPDLALIKDVLKTFFPDHGDKIAEKIVNETFSDFDDFKGKIQKEFEEIGKQLKCK